MLGSGLFGEETECINTCSHCCVEAVSTAEHCCSQAVSTAKRLCNMHMLALSMLANQTFDNVLQFNRSACNCTPNTCMVNGMCDDTDCNLQSICCMS